MPAAESPKYRAAEQRVPEELRPEFQRLVKEYEFCTTLRYGRGYVAYEVLADLILAGWRASATPHATSPL
ncbi:MAG TPA: hypothetical protein VGR35_23690 [Tepidisphaeraceae bacterium]|nr:hypothetical protein [Tepidisphaeraceae bacterium]